VSYHTPLRYLVSGGFSLRQVAPTASYPLFAGIECLLRPLSPIVGMFMTIVIEKHGCGRGKQV
jgi:hypothetical protein